MQVKRTGKCWVTCALMLMFGGIILPAPTWATNEVWYLLQSSNPVFLNFSSNYDYFPRDLPFRYRHEIEALSFVRRHLVERGQLQDRPLLIRIHDPGFTSHPEHSQVALEQDCSLWEGQEIIRTLDSCYAMDVTGSTTHEALLEMAFTLPALTPATPKIEMPAVPETRATPLAVPTIFQDIRLEFDPIWSPDGSFLIYTVWQNGSAHFELISPQNNQPRRLETLDGYMVARPVWSPDARYVAYASLNEIKIFDTRENATHTISLAQPGKGSYNETGLRFEGNGRLIYSGDTNLFAGYKIFVYDLKTQQSTLLEDNAARPEWGEGALTEVNFVGRQRVSSSDGRSVAVVTDEDGLTRVSIETSPSAAQPTARSTPRSPSTTTSPTLARLWPWLVVTVLALGGWSFYLLRRSPRR